MKFAYLLHKRGFVDSQMVTTVLCGLELLDSTTTREDVQSHAARKIRKIAVKNIPPYKIFLRLKKSRALYKSSITRAVGSHE